jgi:hypothetical protein
MRQTLRIAALVVAAAGPVVAGQNADADKVLAAARSAMGGSKLEAVTALSATGRTLRPGPDGNTRETEFELDLALPDKYLMRSVIAAMGNMSIYRMTGFNGGQPIEEIDRPPNLMGGNIIVAFRGPGGTETDPAKMTPAQKAEFDAARLVSAKREFTKLGLGMLAAALPSYPVTFTHAGQAESPDGTADVLEVAGEGGFAARLFVDAKTHLPLMLTWMDKEPLIMQMTTGGRAGGPPPPPPSGGGGVVVQQFSTGGGAPSKEDFDKMAAARKDAEAKRRTVEFRLYYGDYRPVGGVKLPHSFQRSVDGKPTEEMVIDSFKVNPKIDVKKFQVSK